MKKSLFILLFSLISAVSIGQNVRYDTIRYVKEHYEKRVAMFGNEPVVKHKIIFLGNNLTEFGYWKTLLNDPGVINRGIAGDIPMVF